MSWRERFVLLLSGLLVTAWVSFLVWAATGFGAIEKKRIWHRAHVTAYSTGENLTGCVVPGRCYTACGTLLRDELNTVAVRLGIGLDAKGQRYPPGPACGARITVCKPWPKWRCRKAIVNDRTLSEYDMEFSKNLSLAIWQDAACWWCPRTAIWRKGW